MSIEKSIKSQNLKANRLFFGRSSWWLGVVAVLLIVSGVRSVQAQTLDSAFNPDVQVGGEVRAISTQADGKTIIGGKFIGVAGQTRIGLARLNVPGSKFDFDGDGRADISIFRPASGEWWVNRSSNGSAFAAQFGLSTDKIVPADYDGDGKTDTAVFRPASANWFVNRSTVGILIRQFGLTSDRPVPSAFVP